MILINNGAYFESHLGGFPEKLVFFINENEKGNDEITNAVKNAAKNFPLVTILQIEWKLFYEKYENIYCDNANWVLKIGYGHKQRILDTSEANLIRVLSEIDERRKSGRSKFVALPEHLNYNIQQLYPSKTEYIDLIKALCKTLNSKKSDLNTAIAHKEKKQNKIKQKEANLIPELINSHINERVISNEGSNISRNTSYNPQITTTRKHVNKRKNVEVQKEFSGVITRNKAKMQAEFNEKSNFKNKTKFCKDSSAKTQKTSRVEHISTAKSKSKQSSKIKESTNSIKISRTNKDVKISERSLSKQHDIKRKKIQSQKIKLGTKILQKPESLRISKTFSISSNNSTLISPYIPQNIHKEISQIKTKPTITYTQKRKPLSNSKSLEKSISKPPIIVTFLSNYNSDHDRVSMPFNIPTNISSTLPTYTSTFTDLYHMTYIDPCVNGLKLYPEQTFSSSFYNPNMTPQKQEIKSTNNSK